MMLGSIWSYSFIFVDIWLYCIDLVISGHTHGGQIRIPFSFAPFLFSKYGQRYSGGLVELEHTQVYVSRGIGVIPPPIRFNCPPEVPLLTLRRA